MIRKVKKKNVQKPASKNHNRTWHKFKTGLLIKMQKHVSPVVVTGSRTVLKAKQKTKNSWHSITAKTKQEKKKKGLFKCLSKGCKVWKKSKFGVQCHIIEKHPAFRWKCQVCTKDFARHQGRYKHELRHKYGFHFDCKRCHYRCMFEHEMEEHVKKHDWKNLWKCRKTGCDKMYAAKRS